MLVGSFRIHEPFADGLSLVQIVGTAQEPVRNVPIIEANTASSLAGLTFVRLKAQPNSAMLPSKKFSFQTETLPVFG